MGTDAGGATHGRRPRVGGWQRTASGRARPAHARAAFTLLEILLAVALLGLLSAALISVAADLTDNRPRTAQEVFWESVRSARKTALKAQTEVTLSFDAKEKRFVVDNRGKPQMFPILAAGDLTVDLLQAQSGSSVLIGGQLVDTRTLPRVSFYEDGTCMPFRVQFRTNGPAQIIAIDPWTCAPVLTEPKTP